MDKRITLASRGTGVLSALFLFRSSWLPVSVHELTILCSDVEFTAGNLVPQDLNLYIYVYQKKSGSRRTNGFDGFNGLIRDG